MAEADGPNGAEGRHTGLKPITLIRALLLLAPWAFIAYLYRDVGEVRDAFEDATPVLLIVALALTLVAIIGVGVIWVGLIDHLGGLNPGVDRRALLRTYARSWIARYIPGVAWTYGARFVHSEQGVPRRVMATSMVSEFAMMAAVTTSVGAGLWLWGAVNIWLGIGTLVASLAMSVYFATRVNRMTHWALDHVGRILPKRFRSLAEELEGDQGRAELSAAASARFCAGFAIVALASGLSFYFVLLSLTDVPADELPRAVGAYNLATILSIAIIFVPAGLGVREASLAALVTPIVSEPVAATAALVFRVITLLADGIFLGGAELIGRSRSDGDSRAANGPGAYRQ